MGELNGRLFSNEEVAVSTGLTAAEDWGTLAMECACVCLQLHLVPIVGYLFTEMLKCYIEMFSDNHTLAI